ncbi:hypothetical protein ACFQ0B_53435 [Nonomuraea thailandensis]
MSRTLLVVVLLLLTGCSAPAELPGFTEPARSVEEVARRLRAYELRGEEPFPAAGDVFQLCPGSLDPRAPAEPQAFPALVAHLKTDPPVHARFMLLPDPARAAGLVARAAEVARGCAGPASGTLGEAMEAETTVSAFDRGGWSGVQVITSGRRGSDTDDPFFHKPFTTGQSVVHQGAWVVELGWDIRGGFGSPDGDWAATGLKVSESVLAVADGAVTAPRAQDRMTRLTHALPAPGAYGEQVRIWPEPGEPRQYREEGDGPPMSNDLSCGTMSSRERLPGFLPSAERSLLGEVAVHEMVSVAPDEQQAERLRRGWLHDGTGSSAPDPCAYSGPGFVHSEETEAKGVAPSVTAFRHGEWTGRSSGSPRVIRRRAPPPATATPTLMWRSPYGRGPSPSTCDGRARQGWIRGGRSDAASRR